MGGVTTGEGAAGTVTADTAEAPPAAAEVRVETGGVMATTVESTGGTATAGRGATPDDNLINLIIIWGFELTHRSRSFILYRPEIKVTGMDVTCHTYQVFVGLKLVNMLTRTCSIWTDIN